MRGKAMIRKKHALALTLAACTFVPFAHAGDLNFSGFLSVGGGVVDDEDSIGYAGYSEEDLTFDKNLLGLQVSGQVADKLTATAQMIARSGSDYDLTSEWAYLTYQVTDNSKIRAGRLRTPFYMYSDFLDVGYAYSWITPPNEVYYLPFNGVDGIDFYSSSTLGVFDTSLQVYFGGFDEVDGDSTYATRNQLGFAGTIGKDWWTLRAAYHQAKLTVLNPDLAQLAGGVIATGVFLDQDYTNNAAMILAEDDDVTFMQLGINIDTGRFVAAAEYVELDATDSILGKDVRSYVMGGVRAGDWLFHLTAAKSDDEIATPEAGIIQIPQTEELISLIQGAAAANVTKRDVITLGARWDFTSSAALKFQLDDVDDQSGDQKVLSVAVQTVF